MTTGLAMAARAARVTQMEWHGSTFVHPAAIAVTALLGFWFFFASRKTAMFPLMILICFIPSAQRIVILGADFTLLRIMVLIGLARSVARGELSSIRFNRIDGIYVAWVLIGSLVYVLQRQDFGAVVYVSGTSMDMLGAYLVARALVQSLTDLRSFSLIAAVIAVPVAAFFAFEMTTQRNLFAFFGGVREITWVRDGRLRCQGAFAHPILAGVFWAAIGALSMGGAVARWPNPLQRILFVAGTAGAVLVIVASASSTPVLGFVAGVGFWVWWPIRNWMRYVFISAPFLVIALHLAMEKPVWHLVGRMSAVGGSTGYHRFVLIDGAIRHLNEWWLVGTPWTGHWSSIFQTWDITNQYIFEGVRGGIWRLALFVALIYLVGRSIATAQGRVADKSDRLLLWGLGASLFVHCVCFIGVSYFGQIQYLWYITLAIGASAFAPEFSENPDRRTEPVQRQQTRRFFESPGKPELVGG